MDDEVLDPFRIVSAVTRAASPAASALATPVASSSNSLSVSDSERTRPSGRFLPSSASSRVDLTMRDRSFMPRRSAAWRTSPLSAPLTSKNRPSSGRGTPPSTTASVGVRTCSKHTLRLPSVKVSVRRVTSATSSKPIASSAGSTLTPTSYWPRLLRMRSLSVRYSRNMMVRRAPHVRWRTQSVSACVPVAPAGVAAPAAAGRR
mmetsp:Transcript_9041/g.36978  ORF Transcript_9041/g.36978 Transcript_9041/m.36978 type:complete len:204 (-) Transcript_9041:1391-2002(-)